MGRLRMRTEFLWENLFKNGRIKYLDGDGRITLRWILNRLAVRMGGVWNWFRIVSNGR
jgi:hypothetical protein